ncbi:MAG: hypothetical protein ACREPD_10920 [Stenotrophomonas sp.]|uniref:hypothetical protein n=1 Tax=Stenotrophomonas sp. TaxID=69392 RepID=UPI003D6D506C
MTNAFFLTLFAAIASRSIQNAALAILLLKEQENKGKYERRGVEHHSRRPEKDLELFRLILARQRWIEDHRNQPDRR